MVDSFGLRYLGPHYSNRTAFECDLPCSGHHCSNKIVEGLFEAGSKARSIAGGEGHLPKAVKGSVEFGLKVALVCRIMLAELGRCNNLVVRRESSSCTLSQRVDFPRYRTVGRVLVVRFAMEELRVMDGMAVWAARAVVSAWTENPHIGADIGRIDLVLVAGTDLLFVDRMTSCSVPRTSIQGIRGEERRKVKRWKTNAYVGGRMKSQTARCRRQTEVLGSNKIHESLLPDLAEGVGYKDLDVDAHRRMQPSYPNR